MEQLLFGTAYYDEYMPYDRLDRDIEMMKKADINLVRIAESTWSTLEPHDNVFNFYHIDRVLDAMEKAEINVIVGTPTYAIPPWMEKKHSDILTVTKNGRRIYGARQIMDITNSDYIRYCERMIRKLMEHICDKHCIIGYQIDNETKHYETAGPNVQEDFKEYLKEKFQGDIQKMNDEFGFHYWSNAVHDWDDLPDVRGTINGSFGGEFEKYQRKLVTDFLSWQAAIVSEYKKPEQFITHNFDFGWKCGSYGVQPDVDHFKAAECLTVTGCDIYHPTQDKLTGAEIAFGGDLARSLKRNNYLVLETEAQGFPEWEPYDGQLYLQAFSHLASGADCVEYWHWHSLHNALETYWRGILSHDLMENNTYREVVRIGGDFKRLSDSLLHLKKKNRIAIMVSNEALTGLKWFPIAQNLGYNEVVRWIYDALYECNLECDFINPDEENLDQYKLLILPALYCIPENALEKIRRFTENGGILIATFKTAFCNENVKVYHDTQPHVLHKCFGISYQHFTYPVNVLLDGKLLANRQTEATGFMECIVPMSKKTETLLCYVHKNWGKYSAVTTHPYGTGKAYYLGCMFSKEVLKDLLNGIAKEAGISSCVDNAAFPVIVRCGINQQGNKICYLLNYSTDTQNVICPDGDWKELLCEKLYAGKENICLPAWGVAILESR